MISVSRGLVFLFLSISGSLWQKPFVGSHPLGMERHLRSFIWSIRKQSILDNFKQPALERFKSFSCAGRNDQLYPDFGTKCRNYYRCLDGVPYAYACPFEEIFDMETQECLPRSIAKCSDNSKITEKCLYQPDGFYPNYEEKCTSYYRCHNGTISLKGHCRGSSIWDSATGSCVSGSKVVCSPPSCSGLQDGFYPLPRSGCTSYFSCKDGLRTDMLCRHGSVFDYMQKKCISDSNAVCYEKACDGKTNGLHASPQASCDTFYECFNGAMIRLEKCPFGQIFDGRQCVSSNTFTCIHKETGSGYCAEHTDGMHPLQNSNCRGFFFCRNSQLVRHFKCARDLVFNGHTCVNTTNFICTEPPPAPNCFKKFDGYYIISYKDCTRFYRCQDSKKISEHLCPGGTVFNGRKCVSEQLYSCPSKFSSRESFVDS